MFSIDTQTRTITLPQGDTATFRVRVSGGELPAGAVGVFAVCTDKSRPANLFAKAFPLVNGKLDIRLTNADTRGLPVGNHRWDVRLVTDPEYDESGNVRCDHDSDDVLSLFAGSGLPAFIVSAIAKEV